MSTGGLYITEQIVIGKMEAEIQASDEAVRVWCHGASANRSIRVKDSEMMVALVRVLAAQRLAGWIDRL